MLPVKLNLDISEELHNCRAMTCPNWLGEQEQRQLQRVGFDIIAPFRVQDYNRAIADKASLEPLRTFGHAATSALLIGNTRALWPHFKAALAQEPQRLTGDPLDDYVIEEVSKVIEALPFEASPYWAHTLGDGQVSMLHAAALSGFADLGPAHMAVHPTLGPWFALRALVVVDRPSSSAAPPRPELCAPCSAPCVDALERAQALSKVERVGRGLGANWRLWLGVRDACPLGQDARYSDAQIRYHYAGERGALFSPEP